jgi:thiamine-monophosphate kinase
LSNEAIFIELMRAIANDPAARGLLDDVAVVPFGSETLILTHDMMVEGVHWLPDGDPADIAWKLVAANLSDLAAKGAEPFGVLLGYMLGDSNWDHRFAAGLKEALGHYSVSLLGGDSVGRKELTDPRAIGLTALGRATYLPVPSRTGAKAGDRLWVTGTLGDACAGFRCLSSGMTGHDALVHAFNRPEPRLYEGKILAPNINAMMDVSDGLLLDAHRMAEASGLALTLYLDTIPLSDAYRNLCGNRLENIIEATNWGDDYELLFAAVDQNPVRKLCSSVATQIGFFSEGKGLTLISNDEIVSLPAILGFQHQ